MSDFQKSLYPQQETKMPVITNIEDLRVLAEKARAAHVL